MTFEKWALVRCGSDWFVGRVDEQSQQTFRFAETYKIVFLELPSGNERGVQSVGLFIDIHPVLAFGGVVPMYCDASATIFLDDIDTQDRVSIMRKVEDCKGKQKQIRAERAGISLATTLPKH